MAGQVIDFTIDTSRLQEAFAYAAESSTRKMSAVMGGAAFDIACLAQRKTPYVEIETIDAELEEVDHVSHGANLHASTKKFISDNRLGGLTWTRGMMIAVQRTNPNSPYSLATDNRWPVAYAGGLKGAARWRFFADVAERMQKSRHSSTHFLQAGWGAVARQLRSDYRAGQGAVIDVESEVMPEMQIGNTQLGTVTRGGSGNLQWLKLENLIGTGMVYPNLSTKRNEALLTHGSGPLQEAVDEVATKLTARYLPRFLADLEKEWNTIK